jgi:hypothetical protein
MILDLKNKQYDRKTLKAYIYAVSLIDILETQTLDITFIVRYILKKKYQLTNEEERITIEKVLEFQPHINHADLIQSLLDYDSDDDSIPCFDTYQDE